MNWKATALLALASGPAAADVSLFEGTPGGVGDVRVYDETGATPRFSPAELLGIQLLPLDFVGRTTLRELDPGMPRLRSDVPGAARLVLPGGAGSLYRFRRDDPGGGPAQFGFFLVAADGGAVPIWETPGTGLLGATDPVHERIGVDPTGTAILVGTTPAAGGNLIEIDLVSRTAQDRTPSLGPQVFQPGGLFLGPDWGVGLTATGPLRFERQPASEAAFVPFPGGAPPTFGADVVASPGGAFAGVVGGATEMLAHVFVFGPKGSAMQATSEASHVSGAGYLPDCPSGPTLAISPDGSRVAWRTEGETRECWVREVQAPMVVSNYQVTADSNFADTLDESGVIAFFSPNQVIGLVGESDPDAPGTVENGDLYCIDMSGEVPGLTNLTLTSGVPAPPFLLKGELGSGGGIYGIPGTAGLLMHVETSGGGGSLMTLDLCSGSAATVLPDVKSLDLVEVAGGDFVLSLRRDLGNDPRELVRLPLGHGTVPVTLGSFSNIVFSRPATRSDGTFAAVIELVSGDLLGRLHVPTAAGSLLSSRPRTLGPAIGFTPLGSLAASLDVPGRSYFFTWPAGGGVSLLPAGNVQGHFLPGS